jgi:aminoglycoside/choline kinase family phosphotransferase
VFAVLAAQRHAKVIGIFTRLCRRDGKAAYLVHIPRVWRLLERALQERVLAPAARWFERHLPGSARIVPPPTGSQ